MQELIKTGFKVRGVVTDNHPANVSAFNSLLKENTGDELYVVLPNADYRTYLFFDSVHLIKNIRNNLLSAKKFVFPAFNFEIGGVKISSLPGYICWSDLHQIHDKDQKLAANLRKAPKLSFNALHPGTNKQNVNLALGVFHETTIAASKSYFPDREDIANFLNLVHTWWTISNSNNKYDANPLGNAITTDDGKILFFEKFAEWLQEWNLSPNFCLSKQTSNALIRTLKSHAMLIRDLLNDGYEYVMTRRLQSDPIENRFSRYRQMSGGRFLVSLREVLSSESILAVRSLLKIGINYWLHDGIRDEDDPKLLEEFLDQLATHETEIMEALLCEDSNEVSHYIAGYMANKIMKRLNCPECKSLMTVTISQTSGKYINLLSRGGLLHPSETFSYNVAVIFAQIDFINSFIADTSVRKFMYHAVEKYAPQAQHSCEHHLENNRKSAINIAINIYYNNKQKTVGDKSRKESLQKFKTRQRNKE